MDFVYLIGLAEFEFMNKKSEKNFIQKFPLIY